MFSLNKSEKLINRHHYCLNMSDGIFEILGPEAQQRFLDGIKESAKAMSPSLKSYDHDDGTIRFGPGDSCKSIPEMEAYFNGVLPQRIKIGFDRHFGECRDCESALEWHVEKLAPTHSKNSVATLYRKALAAYHYIEHLLEQRQHQAKRSIRE